MLVETSTSEDLDKLIQAEELKEGGFVIQKLEAKLPKVVIKEAQSTLTQQNLVAEIYSQNETLNRKYSRDTFCDKLKVVRGWQSTKIPGTCNWILETQPEVRADIMSNGGTICLEWNRIRVADYLDATRCFRCQEYGHVAKHCRHDQNTCGYCGQRGHAFKECPNSAGEAVCVPCQRRGAPSK